MSNSKNFWFKLILIIIVIGLIVTILKITDIDFSKITEEEFKHWVESLGSWGPVIYIAVYIFRPLILFPAAILSAASGIIWGPVFGFIYLQIAANLSSAIEFSMSRYLARETIAKHLKGRISHLDDKIEKHGFLTVLLIRLIPNVAWDIQNFSLGLTKVRKRDYFLATFLGIMPGSFALVFLGSSIIKILFNPKNLWIAGIAVSIFAAINILQRHLKKLHHSKIKP